jgi:GntR family transcriptional regulator
VATHGVFREVSLFFQINPANGVPVYEQIARQITYAIASGGITSGELVPSVRTLSREMAVNPNTVARAYRQLQDSGILETVRGEGLLVTSGAKRQCQSERKKIMSERMLSVLVEARQSQLTDDEIQTMFEDARAKSKKSANSQRTGARS